MLISKYWSWPLFLIFVILIFRIDLRNLLQRISKVQIFGQTLDFKEVNKLQEAAKKLHKEVEVPIGIEIQEEEWLKKSEKEVWEATSIKPELGIIVLSRLLERETRVLAASVGTLAIKDAPKLSFNKLFDLLINKGYLSKHILEPLGLFLKLRNKIIHGHFISSDDKSIIRVLDIGLKLLRDIHAIPHEIHIVSFNGIELFLDSACTNKIKDTKGIILESISSDHKQNSRRIFPTKHPTYYKNGMRVSWEWNLSNKWGPVWYIDPDTNEKKKAWEGSMEFAGRDISEL